MPSLDQINSGFSSNSSVQISNDTRCELVLRYSGPDAKMISIRAGETSTVYLSSGRYKITASACGENYFGTEDLHRGTWFRTLYGYNKVLTHIKN